MSVEITLVTFGVKNKKARYPEADFYVDARFLPNPPHLLMHLSGRDLEVKEFLLHHLTVSSKDRKRVTTLTSNLLKLCETTSEGIYEKYIVGVYCYGGRHRSVFLAEHFQEALSAAGVVVNVRHYNIPKN